MPAKIRMRRSMARVEFLCCTESIEGMLQQGFSKQLIYEDLKEKGRISMAYVTFCKLIAKAMNSELAVQSLRPAPKPVTPPPLPPAARPAQSGIIKARPDALQDPRTIDPATVF